MAPSMERSVHATVGPWAKWRMHLRVRAATAESVPLAASWARPGISAQLRSPSTHTQCGNIQPPGDSWGRIAHFCRRPTVVRTWEIVTRHTYPHSRPLPNQHGAWKTAESRAVGAPRGFALEYRSEDENTARSIEVSPPLRADFVWGQAGMQASEYGIRARRCRQPSRFLFASWMEFRAGSANQPAYSLQVVPGRSRTIPQPAHRADGGSPSAKMPRPTYSACCRSLFSSKKAWAYNGPVTVGTPRGWGGFWPDVELANYPIVGFKPVGLGL